MTRHSTRRLFFMAKFMYGLARAGVSSGSHKTKYFKFGIHPKEIRGLFNFGERLTLKVFKLFGRTYNSHLFIDLLYKLKSSVNDCRFLGIDSK